MSERLHVPQQETVESEPTGIELLQARVEALYVNPNRHMQVQMQIDGTAGTWEDSTVYGPVYGVEGPAQRPVFETDADGKIHMKCSFVTAGGSFENFESVDETGTLFQNSKNGTANSGQFCCIILNSI